MKVSAFGAGARWLAAAGALIALAGCAGVGPGAASPEQSVRERANAHWRARLARNLDEAYMFLPPSHRAIRSLDSYKKSMTADLQINAAQVEKVACETADKCIATTKIEGKIVMLRANTPPLVTYFDETWIRENGQWWLFPGQ